MTDVAVLDGDVEALFSLPISACVATPEMRDAPPAPGEAARVARARPERRAEFAAGRAAARAALQRLGLHGVAIASQGDRSPLWPQGYVGSISHCEGFCAAVATHARHAQGLGFDAEPAQVLPEKVRSLVCSDDDLRAAPPGLQSHPLWPTVVFSAKEAAYKCQYPVSKEVLGFEAATIFPDGTCWEHGGAFGVRFGPAAPARLDGLEFRGRWRLLAGLVLTGVWLAPPGSA